jgi:hypothetical protein
MWCICDRICVCGQTPATNLICGPHMHCDHKKSENFNPHILPHTFYHRKYAKGRLMGFEHGHWCWEESKLSLSQLSLGVFLVNIYIYIYIFETIDRGCQQM